MKKVAASIILFLFVLTLVGCFSQTQQLDSSAPLPNSSASLPESTPVVREGEAVQVVRAMMDLDYDGMTVSAFNEAIQKLSADAGTTVFEAISDTYDHFAVYDDAGEFVGTVFDDPGLETFMETTLAYSSQEIFGEPVQLGSVMYMIMPGMTALEVYQKKEGMQADEWNRFFNENIASIQIFPILSYGIDTDIPNPETLLVAVRDSRLNDVESAIISYFIGLNEETAMAENLFDTVEAEFERLSAQKSDDQIGVKCRIQGLERDIPE